MEQRLAVRDGASAAFGASPGLRALPAPLEGLHTPLRAGRGSSFSCGGRACVSLITQTQLRPSWLHSHVTAGHGAGGVQPRVACCCPHVTSEEASSARPAEAARQPRDSLLPAALWCRPFLSIRDSSRCVPLTVTSPGLQPRADLKAGLLWRQGPGGPSRPAQGLAAGA